MLSYFYYFIVILFISSYFYLCFFFNKRQIVQLMWIFLKKIIIDTFFSPKIKKRLTLKLYHWILQLMAQNYTVEGNIYYFGDFGSLSVSHHGCVLIWMRVVRKTPLRALQRSRLLFHVCIHLEKEEEEEKAPTSESGSRSQLCIRFLKELLMNRVQSNESQASQLKSARCQSFFSPPETKERSSDKITEKKMVKIEISDIAFTWFHTRKKT